MQIHYQMRLPQEIFDTLSTSTLENPPVWQTYAPTMDPIQATMPAHIMMLTEWLTEKQTLIEQLQDSVRTVDGSIEVKEFLARVCYRAEQMLRELHDLLEYADETWEFDPYIRVHTIRNLTKEIQHHIK